MVDYSNANRETQLSWCKPGSVIRQDQELIDLIKKNNFTAAIGHGDVGYFKPYINLIDSGPVNFCIYIQQAPYRFDQLVSHVNHIIEHDLVSNGLMYLAFNKYIAVPDRYDMSLPADYDQAIYQYIKQNTNATIEQYFACGLDHGQKFNWVHPLTRFLIRKP